MDASHLTRLKEEQEHALAETDANIKQWEKFKSDYVALKERLKTLPDKVTHDVMVPFGSLAFMPGQLVHTNEILVLLGENWFAERSAKQSVSIINRRLKEVENQLTELRKQKQLLEPRLGFTTDIQQTAQEQDVVEITEKYDEENERKWKEEHRKNVQKHKQNIKESSDSNTPMTNEELWARLDELEKIERKRKEYQRLTGDDVVPLTEKTESESEEEYSDTDSNSLSSNSDSDDDDDDDYDEDEEDEENDDDGDDDDNDDTDTGDPSTRIITFTHTKPPNQKSTTASTDSSAIISPSDIYKLVNATDHMQSDQPKSILKSNNNGKQRVKKRVKMKEDIEEDSRKRAQKQLQPRAGDGPVAFSGTVVEKPTLVKDTIVKKPETNENVQDSQPRRVSKFKAERQKKTSSS